MLLTGHSVEEMLMARDTVIFFLQQLEFVLNLKKSVLTPTQRVDFLGVTLDSFIMNLSLPEKKVSKAQKQYLEFLQKTQVLILELTKLIGLLSSIIQAVLLAQVRATTNTSIKTQERYCKKVILNRSSKEALQEWIQSLKICNSCYLIQSLSQQVPCSQMLIQTDTSKKGWDAVCQWMSTGGNGQGRNSCYT